MGKRPTQKAVRDSVLPGYQLLSFKKSGSDVVVAVSTTDTDAVPDCPRCWRSPCVRNGRRIVTARDVIGNDLPARLEIRRKRFRCKACGHPFFEQLPGVLSHRRMTIRLTERIRASLFSTSYNAIARSLRIDEKSVRNVAEESFAELESTTRFATPRTLLVLELKVAGRKCALLFNLPESAVVGLAPSHTGKQLRGALVSGFDETPAVVGMSLDEPTLSAAASAFHGRVQLRLYVPWLCWRIESQFRRVIAGIQGWEGNGQERRVLASPFESLVGGPFLDEKALRSTIEEVLEANVTLCPHFEAYQALQTLFLHQPASCWMTGLAEWWELYPNDVRRHYRWLEPMLRRALGVTELTLGTAAHEAIRSDAYPVREQLRLFAQKRSLQSIRALLLLQRDTHLTRNSPAGTINLGANAHMLARRLRGQLIGVTLR